MVRIGVLLKRKTTPYLVRSLLGLTGKCMWVRGAISVCCSLIQKVLWNTNHCSRIALHTRHSLIYTQYLPQTKQYISLRIIQFFNGQTISCPIVASIKGWENHLLSAIRFIPILPIQD